MPLLDAFKIKDCPSKPAIWHVPWWWAFASDQRYQISPSKDRTIAARHFDPSRSPRRVEFHGELNTSTSEHITQAQSPQRNKSISRHSQYYSKSPSAVIQPPSPASKYVDLHRDHKQFRSTSKALPRSTRGKCGKANGSDCWSTAANATYLPHDLSKRQFKYNTESMACQAQTLIQPARGLDHLNVEPILKTAFLERPSHRNKASAKLSLPLDPSRRPCIRRFDNVDRVHPVLISDQIVLQNNSEPKTQPALCFHTQDNDLKAASPNESPTSRLQLYGLHQPTAYQFFESRMIDADCSQSDFGMATSSFHTCPRTPHLPFHPASYTEDGYQKAIRRPAHPALSHPPFCQSRHETSLCSLGQSGSYDQSQALPNQIPCDMRLDGHSSYTAEFEHNGPCYNEADHVHHCNHDANYEICDMLSPQTASSDMGRSSFTVARQVRDSRNIFDGGSYCCDLDHTYPRSTCAEVPIPQEYSRLADRTLLSSKDYQCPQLSKIRPFKQRCYRGFKSSNGNSNFRDATNNREDYVTPRSLPSHTPMINSAHPTHVRKQSYTRTRETD